MATLYDHLGRKVDTGVLKEERAAATVAGIRNIYSTIHIAASLTPERLTAVLRQAEFSDTYYYLEFARDLRARPAISRGALDAERITRRAGAGDQAA